MTIIKKEDAVEEQVKRMSMEIEMVDFAAAFEYYANGVLFKTPVKVDSVTKGKSGNKFIVYFHLIEGETPLPEPVEEHRSRKGVLNPDGAHVVPVAYDVSEASAREKDAKVAKAEDA